MREQIVERFDLEGEDNASIASMLAQQDSDTLLNLVEEFSVDDINIDLDGDESQQCMVMSYALASALEDEREVITAEDIENAQAEFSADLDQTDETVEDESDAEHEQQASNEDELDDSEEKLPNLRETVYNIVANNVDAQKSEVVSQVLDIPRFSDKNEGTIAVHYYNARKEFDLPTIGKRGRPAGSGKLNDLVEKLASTPNMSRAEAIEWAVDNLELAETTATNYYSTARKQVDGE